MIKWDKLKKDLKATSPEEQYILDFMSKLIGQIIVTRKKKKITQKELAKLAKIEQSTIARIETWKVTPSISTILKIAFVLDIEIDIYSLD